MQFSKRINVTLKNRVRANDPLASTLAIAIAPNQRACIWSPNGWFRLGVLLSVLWLLGVAGLAWVPGALPTIGGWLYPCRQDIDPLCLFETVSYGRLVAIAILPLLAGWFLGYGIGWVRRGFGTGQPIIIGDTH